MTSKLEQLKAHQAFPFARFREDEVEYMMLELYWVEVFKTALGPAADAYLAWQAPDVEQLGNPIFSALSGNFDRGVIIKAKWMAEGQRPYREGGTYFPFQPYLGVYSAHPREPEPRVPALVFLADLTPEAEALATDFLRAFCVDRLAPQEMEARCAAYEIAVGMPP